jgi:TetR/AcrR family transcriptional repressor of nem operon
MKKKSWLDKIRAYIKLYEQVLWENKLCLCGMLASDIETLPSELKVELQHFFSDNIAWLTKILLSHPAALSKKRLENLSWQIISSLQGGIMLARIFSNPKLFSANCKELILSLEQVT